MLHGDSVYICMYVCMCVCMYVSNATQNAIIANTFPVDAALFSCRCSRAKE